MASSRLSRPLEHGTEHAIELVEVALILHQSSAGEVIEVLHRLLGEVGVQRLHQRQIFAQGHRDLRIAERREELQKHGIQIARRAAGVKGRRISEARASAYQTGLDREGFSSRIEP
jgi:hypothetical protein